MPYTQPVYEFGNYLLDPQQQVLLCNGKRIHLTLKAFSVLRILVERAGQVVGKDELMYECWPNTFVEEANLPENIHLLRQVLGDNRKRPDYIETVYRRGYRFVATVTLRDWANATDSTSQGDDVREIHTSVEGNKFFDSVRMMLTQSREAELERRIGQLTIENDFLKKLLRSFGEQQEVESGSGSATRSRSHRRAG